MIKYRGLTFLHKLISTKIPCSLYNLLKPKRYDRGVSNITLKYIPKNNKYKNFFINKYIPIYNSLDGKLKEKSIKKFKSELKLQIPYQTSDTMD